MDAAAVRTALRRRWPEDRYIHVCEAPLDSARMSSKIDVAVIALWRSLKLEIDAVEVKVSYSDWQNEIKQYHWVVDYTDEQLAINRAKPYFRDRERYEEARHARSDAEHWGGVSRRVTELSTAKSIDWREHAHRFWIACPNELAIKIAPELPQGWGLLGVLDDGTTRVVVKPETVPPRRLLDWPKVIGLIRAAADAGLAALARAEQRGRESMIALAQARSAEADDLREQLRVARGEPERGYLTSRN